MYSKGKLREKNMEKHHIRKKAIFSAIFTKGKVVQKFLSVIYVSVPKACKHWGGKWDANLQERRS